VHDMVQHLDSSWLHFNEETTAKLEAAGCLPSKQNVRAGEFLCRSDVRIDLLQALGLVPADLADEVAREVETVVKYAGYVSRQQGEVERLHRMEERPIPAVVDYSAVRGLRTESRENLSRVSPLTVGQASRVPGVTTSDIAVLLVYLEQARRQTAGSA